MSTGVGCTVYIDGTRLADGRDGEAVGEPVALSGLNITWGRETTVDQPPASTCSFRVLDEQGGRAFINVLRTGLRVDVTAEATIISPPGEGGTFLDPGFELGYGPHTITGGWARVTTTHPHTGSRSLEITPDRLGPVTVILPPAPFVPGGTDPGAWDAITQAEAGTPWAFSAALRLPPFASGVLRPVLFSGPYASAYTVIDEPVASAPGAWEWETLQGTFTPEISGRWVGVALTINPAGARWLDMPGTWADTPGAWWEYGSAFIDDVTVYAPGGAEVRRVLVFSGRITDLAASYDSAADASVVEVTAADFTADLDNVRVGDEPWPVETMGERFARILQLSGYPMTTDLAPSVTGTLVSYQDVDSQAVTGLLQDLAQSVDAVLWSATHQVAGPYLVLEDPGERRALYVLALIDGQVQIIVGPGGAGALDVSACDILRDPVSWSQNVSDVATRVSVTWLEQGTDEDGQSTTTDRTFTLIDEDAEETFGRRSISVSTVLQAVDDAAEVAGRILSRTSFSGWRASGLTIDDDESLELPDDDATAEMLLLLLDGTRRIGLPMRLTDLPAWTPVGAVAPVYLEGGTYSFIDGTWELALSVSGADSLARSIRWAELDPTWSWADMAPTISWNDLYGVGTADPDTPIREVSHAVYARP